MSCSGLVVHNRNSRFFQKATFAAATWRQRFPDARLFPSQRLHPNATAQLCPAAATRDVPQLFGGRKFRKKRAVG
jgi:hypothetical protein